MGCQLDTSGGGGEARQAFKGIGCQLMQRCGLTCVRLKTWSCNPVEVPLCMVLATPQLACAPAPQGCLLLLQGLEQL